MLTLKKTKDKEYDLRWKKFVSDFYNINIINDDKNKEIYKEIIYSIDKIEKIETIVNLDVTKSIPDIQSKLISEQDKLRIDASFNFIKYLVEQENIELGQRVEYFFMGIDCLTSALLYSGETLFLLKPLEIITLIKRLHESLNTWKNINELINEVSISLLHENSLRLIYASLYMLEDTYRYQTSRESMQTKNNHENSWSQEDEVYESLLENMSEWSQEEWSQEEQSAFERAMSNL